MLTLTVHGTPVPQGSHQGYVIPGKNGGKPRAVVVDDNKRTVPWRQDVTAAALNTIAEHPNTYPLAGPVRVIVTFYMPRPGYHFRTGRYAGELKPNAPTYVDKKPDGDKLLRSLLDALTTAGVFRDDAQVAVLTGVKRYADGPPGAHIIIEPLLIAALSAPRAEQSEQAALL